MQKKILIIISIFCVSANLLLAQTSKKIDVSLKNATLKEFLSTIEKQTDYTFMYDNIDMTQKINVDKHQLSVNDLLHQVLSVKGISYSIKGHQVILKQNDVTSRTVSGMVKDSKGEALIGVIVREEGGTNGTITDLDGKFVLKLMGTKSKIRLSYVGYMDKVISIENEKNMTIVMAEDTKKIDEVVVIGYGTVKKTSLSAAVSTLKGQELSQKPLTDITNGFAGRIAGVIAQQSSGEPGIDGSTIRIRGTSTVGNASPLFVVDGVPRSSNNIDPNDIASFTILKDAAAVAPYGMGGANGVILITTKRGKTGAPTLSYDGYFGIQNPTRMPQMVNSYQYALLQNEASVNSGMPNMPFSGADIAQYRKTVDGASDANPDMYPNSHGLSDVIQKNAILTHHNLQLSGGTEFVKYFFSLGYTSQDGQFAPTWLKRYNAQLSIDIQATPTTKVSASASGYVVDQHFPGKVDLGAGGGNRYTAANGGIMYQAFRTPPTSAIYYSNGLWGSYIGKSLVGYIYNSGYAKNEDTQLYTTFSIDQEIPFIKGLSLKGLVSYDPYSSFNKIWQTPILAYTPDFSVSPTTFNPVYTEFSNPQLTEGTNQNKAFTYQASFDYHTTFKKNSLNILGLAEARQQQYWNMNAQRKDFPISIDELDNGGIAEGDVSNGGSSSTSAQVGFVYRGSYNYDQKYFAEVAGRYDGNYYFAPGHRWGFFPSLSLAWNMAKENFIKDKQPWIDMLKVRSSIGSSGNLAGSDYQYLTGYQSYGNAAFFNGSATTGLYEKTPQANPNITWERANKFDLGLDASLWNGLLTVQFDYFYEKRSDMLWQSTVMVPEEYGTTMPQINSAIMSNHGVEFSIGTTHRFSNGLRIDINGNFTFARNNMIQEFETGSTYNNPNRRRTGRPWGTQFGYKAIGYYTAADFLPNGALKPSIASIPGATVHPGDLKYADLSGPNGVSDGIIDSNDETVIGSPNGTPGIIYGFNPHLSYKGFDLDVLVQGGAILSLPIGGSLVFPFDQQGSASELAYLDHWTPNNTKALYPRVYLNQPAYNTTYSSWWCRNADYLRLKSLELGYTFPRAIVRKMGMSQLRMYISGQNLLTWTPYMKEKIDPEAASSNGQYYYQQQVFSLGINVTF